MQKCFIVPQQLSAKVELDYSKKPNKLDSLTNLFLSENFTINLLLFYLDKSNSNSITDFLVNLLSSKQYKYKPLFKNNYKKIRKLFLLTSNLLNISK